MKQNDDSARVLAVRAVRQVLERRITLESALEATLAAAAGRERTSRSAAVRSLSYGAVRGHFRYQAILGRLLSQPLPALGFTPQAILQIALYELEAARSPQYAIVDAAVEAARAAGASKLSGLINAVLRRYLRERTAIDTAIDADPGVRHAFPAWLARLIESDWPTEATEIMAACDRQAPLWLRINPRRTRTYAYLQALKDAGIGAQASSEVANAIVLDTPCDVHLLPGFAAGWVSVQDLGAQCAAFPLALERGQRVLDACAAPGGKTALIGEREPNLAVLVANELNPLRIPHLTENLARVGVEARIVHADAAAQPRPEEVSDFDRILLDVPCSALGVIRRHPDIRLRREPGDVERFAATQAAILRASWPKLASGGRLVYASCTLARRENHDLLAEFLAAAPEAAVIAPDLWEGWPGFGTRDGIGVQIRPGEAGADGFYYAALSKP